MVPNRTVSSTNTILLHSALQGLVFYSLQVFHIYKVFQNTYVANSIIRTECKSVYLEAYKKETKETSLFHQRYLDRFPDKYKSVQE